MKRLCTLLCAALSFAILGSTASAQDTKIANLGGAIILNPSYFRCDLAANATVNLPSNMDGELGTLFSAYPAQTCWGTFVTDFINTDHQATPTISWSLDIRANLLEAPSSANACAEATIDLTEWGWQGSAWTLLGTKRYEGQWSAPGNRCHVVLVERSGLLAKFGFDYRAYPKVRAAVLGLSYGYPTGASVRFSSADNPG